MKFSDKKIPSSVAVIMDGNGRWAKKRLMPRSVGHKAGVKTLFKIARHAFDVGVKYFTVYAFSTENKNRPKEEVDGLIDLIREHFSSSFDELISRGIAIKILGDRSYFPDDVVGILNQIEVDSASQTNGTMCVALNYGGRAEIIKAVNEAIQKGEEVTEQEFEKYLYTSDIPDPDIILRTGGEKRLSNFLLYQSAYSELFFVDTLWPDFSEKEFDNILEEFSQRNRRYGKV